MITENIYTHTRTHLYTCTYICVELFLHYKNEVTLFDKIVAGGDCRLQQSKPVSGRQMPCFIAFVILNFMHILKIMYVCMM